jgi:hypothetical protein
MYLLSHLRICCPQLLRNSVIAEVGPGTQVSDFATSRELTAKNMGGSRDWVRHEPLV